MTTITHQGPEPKTFSEWLDVYDQVIDNRPLKASTRRDKRFALRYLQREFGARPIDSILPFEIANLSVSVARSGKETTARRIIIEAKDAFNEAMLHDWIYRNPAYTLKTPRPRIKRRRLSLDAWHQMLALTCANSFERALLLLALLSAQRRADLCAMLFDDIHHDLLHIRQQKTGRLIAIPLDLRLEALNLTLGDVIEQCRNRAKGSGFLLTTRRGRPTQPWQLTQAVYYLYRQTPSAKTRSGQGTSPSLHEIRSLAERLYRDQGVDTQTLLGHKFPSMTNRYNDDRGLSSGIWKTVRTGPVASPLDEATPSRAQSAHTALY